MLLWPSRSAEKQMLREAPPAELLKAFASLKCLPGAECTGYAVHFETGIYIYICIYVYDII